MEEFENISVELSSVEFGSQLGLDVGTNPSESEGGVGLSGFNQAGICSETLTTSSSLSHVAQTT